MDANREQSPISVVIADEILLVRIGLKTILNSVPEMITIVSEAENGRQALDAIQTYKPGVLIIDTNLTGVNGLEVTRLTKQYSPSTAVIVLTFFDDEEELFAAIKVGASAYFTKNIRPEDLISAVQRVYTGEYLINDNVLSRPLLASRVLHQFRELASSSTSGDNIIIPLSSREIEVLEHIAHGSSNKEIARILAISDQTVKNHITSILRKMAVKDRTEAVVYAIRHNWIHVDQT